MVFNRVLILFLAFSLSGCASFYSASRKVNAFVIKGDYKSAIEVLKPLAEKDSDDQLVYLLDYGLVLQLDGQYEESIKAFLKADEIADIKDYTSLSRVTGSMLFGEGMMQYRGEDFEKILINVYLAINFLMVGKYDSAQVEARRINEKLLKFKDDAKRDYGQNAFARFISALIWEMDKKYDDAFIDYKEAYEIDGSPLFLANYFEGARRAQRWTEYKKLKNSYPDLKLRDDWKFKKNGELIVIYQQGKGPIKRPNPEFQRVPKLYPRYSMGVGARIDILSPEDNIIKTETTDKVMDVSGIAIKTLNGHYAGMIAKRIGGMVVKDRIAKRISKENQTLGILAFIGMHVADQADLRQWHSLPESFQVARILLPEGEYKVRLDTDHELHTFQNVSIEKGKKTFLNWRSFR